MKIVKRSLERYQLFGYHRNLGWRPSLDLYETEKQLIILMDIAGVQAEEIEMNVNRDRVQIRGNRCRPSEDGVTRIHHMEIDFGPFQHIVSLPEPIDPNGVTSTYRDGFLLIRLPKKVRNNSSNH